MSAPQIGYQKLNLFGDECFDINECEVANDCPDNFACVNTEGDYHCQCGEGYRGKYCDVDIDECEQCEFFSRLWGLRKFLLITK